MSSDVRDSKVCPRVGEPSSGESGGPERGHRCAGAANVAVASTTPSRQPCRTTPLTRPPSSRCLRSVVPERPSVRRKCFHRTRSKPPRGRPCAPLLGASPTRGGSRSRNEGSSSRPNALKGPFGYGLCDDLGLGRLAVAVQAVPHGGRVVRVRPMALRERAQLGVDAAAAQLAHGAAGL